MKLEEQLAIRKLYIEAVKLFDKTRDDYERASKAYREARKALDKDERAYRKAFEEAK